MPQISTQEFERLPLRVHAFLAPAWLTVLVSYEVFSALDQIVAR